MASRSRATASKPSPTTSVTSEHSVDNGDDATFAVPPSGGAQTNVDIQIEDQDGLRFWFPSLTQWYADLNKVHAATVLVLCYCNLINYMDRSTLAGMVSYIQTDPHFKVKSSKSLGLLQTAFVVFYMVFAPVFGYLGDRYNRKWILCFGLSIWSLSTLLGSLCLNFWAFAFFRAMVGIGEASYSTIAPAIISDIFAGDTRSKVLAAFYFAIPVGTGFGYIIGAEVGSHVGDWRWGLRVTPFMGLVAIVLILLIMVDPPRGQSDGSRLRCQSPLQDLRALLKNRSFILSSIAFTCVAFCVGALMWWGPDFAYLGAKAECGNAAGCENITQADISYKFGIVMTFAGLIGVPAGSLVAQTLRHRIPNADPIVCGVSLLISVPVLYFGFVMARYSTAWCYWLTFIAGLLLNCNWSIVSDITLYIVIPTRRSFASATQILASHTLGDAISPYLIGAIADSVRHYISNGFMPNSNATTVPVSVYSEHLAFEFNPMSQKHSAEWYMIEFQCLQYALFICCFCQSVGAFVFLVMSWYVLEDKARADRVILEESSALLNSADDGVPTIHNTYADEDTNFSQPSEGPNGNTRSFST